MSSFEQDFIEQFHASGDGRQFEDPEFAAEERALFESPGVVPDYAKRAGRAVSAWKRPQEWSEAPELFRDTVSTGDVVQGALPDCWLLGAMAAVAAHPTLDLIGALVVSNESDFRNYGIITLRFYKEGEWVEVPVDTRVPFAGDAPLFARCADPQEVWAPLLEKAYAKLHGSYEALAHGSTTEGLVDLTGGVGFEVRLSDPSVQQLALETGDLWRKLCRYLSWGYIVACSHSPQPEESEEETEAGVLCNHAYAVIASKEIRGLKFLRVRNPWGRGDWTGDWCRNSPKWDDNPEVERAMLEDPSTEFTRDEPDGTFWMVWEDFASTFTHMHVCRLFGEDFQQVVVQGEWRARSAGGPAFRTVSRRQQQAKEEERRQQQQRRRRAERLLGKDEGKEEEGKEEGRSVDPATALGIDPVRAGLEGVHTLVDGDSRWFSNPQYRVTCGAPVDVLVSLLQGDCRLRGGGDNVPIRFLVLCRPKGERGRVWDIDPDTVVADSQQASFAPLQPSREISKGSVPLDPGHSYVMVPFTMQGGVEGSFTLRLFSRGELRVEEVPHAYTATCEGAWEASGDVDTAGGPPVAGHKPSYTWAVNPQFVLRFRERHSGGGGGPRVPGQKAAVKLVLRRTDDLWREVVEEAEEEGTHDALAQHVGLTVTRCAAPAATGAKRNASEPRRNALGDEIPSPQSTLRRERRAPARGEGAGEGAAAAAVGGDGGDTQSLLASVVAATGISPDAGGGGAGGESVGPGSGSVVGALGAMRRLHVEADEWAALSEFHGPQEAALLLSRVSLDWASSGLVVVPSLGEAHAEGSFVLEAHADRPIEMVQVPHALVKTVAASWSDSTAAGSHLHEGWNKKNPQFHLKLHCDGPARVRITLARPAKRWGRQIARDSVGCMIGFYLVPGTRVVRHAGRIFHEGAPWNETSFVPMHSVSTPDPFFLEPIPDDGVYTIVPATMEPGKRGPFFLTVAAECDFQLTQVR